jgi:hypothetical protein
MEIAMIDRSPLPRRHLLGAVAAATAGTALSVQAAGKPANDGPPHKIVYQLNRAEPDYQEAILNSIGAMLKKYVDDVAIAVVVWGPGIHLLAKKPQRPVAPAWNSWPAATPCTVWVGRRPTCWISLASKKSAPPR